LRVVYSFSVPDNSIAHWQLKKWKAEGKMISGILLKLIEGDGSQILVLENNIEALQRRVKRQNRILNSLLVANPKMKLPHEWDQEVEEE
jgi:hypothetical protein